MATVTSPSADPIITVRWGEQGDVEACAGLAAEDGAGRADRWASTFRTTIDDARRHRILVVAKCEESVAGYARAVHLNEPQDEDRRMPIGWYLLGVVVDPKFRRRGIGLHLTEARLTWLRVRTHEVYFFTASSNVASKRLHAVAGFVPMPGTMRLKAPSASGTVTEQLLYRLNWAN